MSHLLDKKMFYLNMQQARTGVALALIFQVSTNKITETQN